MGKTVELTVEQEAVIKNYLRLKGLDYVDFTAEIYDHILSDIEQLVAAKEMSFQDAFYQVQKKWNHHLAYSESVFIGLAFSAPKLVLKKIRSVAIKNYILVFALYFGVLIGSFRMDSFFSPSLYVVDSIVILTVLGMLYLQYQLKKTHLKTSYGFLMKAQKLAILVPVFAGIILKTGINTIGVSLLVLGLYSVFFQGYLYRKHQQTIVKNTKIL